MTKSLTLLQAYLSLRLVSLLLAPGFDIVEAVLASLASELFLFYIMLFIAVSQIGIKVPLFAYVRGLSSLSLQPHLRVKLGC